MEINMKTKINSNRSRVVLVWVLIMLFLPVFDVNAYMTNNDLLGGNCVWENSSRYMSAFGLSPDQFAAVQNAMSHWNNVPGSSFQFYMDSGGTSSNIVYLTNSGFGAGDLAYTDASWQDEYVCHPVWQCDWYFCGWTPSCRWHCYFQDADIRFNSNMQWTTDNSKFFLNGQVTPTTTYWYAPYNFESVALHELGHYLGLGHESSKLATMNHYYPNGGPLSEYIVFDPLSDDRAGIRSLYGNGESEVDIAASALKMDTQLPGGSIVVNAPHVDSIPPGQSMAIEYTISNQSTSSQTFNVAFYISTDTNITTSDILLGTVTGVQMAPGSVTYGRNLTIPIGTNFGIYYIGFIVDYDNAVPENNENNNAQYIPVPITIDSGATSYGQWTSHVCYYGIDSASCWDTLSDTCNGNYADSYSCPYGTSLSCNDVARDHYMYDDYYPYEIWDSRRIDCSKYTSPASCPPGYALFNGLCWTKTTGPVNYDSCDWDSSCWSTSNDTCNADQYSQYGTCTGPLACNDVYNYYDDYDNMYSSWTYQSVTCVSTNPL